MKLMRAIWIGLAIMIVSEAATLAKIEPFWSWNTPIAWTGFIIFADAIVWRARRDSWIRSAPREFVLLALVSIPLWLRVRRLQPGDQKLALRRAAREPGAAILRLRLVVRDDLARAVRGAELIASSRAEGRYGGRQAGPQAQPDLPAFPTLPASPCLPSSASPRARSMLASPFVVSPAPSRRTWRRPSGSASSFCSIRSTRASGAESLWSDWRAGRRDRLINLALSGFLCGVLWEFWNYWSRAKWHYTVPIMENLKIFEMPVPGYFGFPAFALECFTMYVFIRRLFTRGGRAIGL